MTKSCVGAFLLLVLLSPGAAPAGETDLAPVIEARPGEAEVLDLETCVAEALARNDALAGEREKRRELKGQKYQAVSIGLPSIDVSADWSKSRDPSFALDPTFSGGGEGGLFDFLQPLYDDYNATRPADEHIFPPQVNFIPEPDAIPASTYWHAQANVSWTLNPLKVIGAVGAANHGINRQELLIRNLENRTVEQTVAAYHTIVSRAEQVSAIEASIANQREFLEITRLRFEMGLATRLDTLQAAVAVANIEPRLRSARRGLQNAGSNLNALMGRSPEAPLSILTDQVVEEDPIDVDRALELARRRPDVESMRVFTELLRRNRAAQQADLRRPYLTLNGSMGYVGNDFGDLTDRSYDFYRASVAVTVPVFDGFLTRGLVQQTEAQIRRNEHDVSGVERQVQVEVLELLNNLDAARRNLVAARLNIDSAREVLDEMTLNYRLGRRDYLTVLEAQSVWADARANLIDARYEVLTLSASFKRAIGTSPLLPLAAIDGLVPGGSQ